MISSWSMIRGTGSYTCMCVNAVADSDMLP